MHYDVIVIGGGPAGIITALTAKSVHREKSVAVIKEIGDGVIPCAIPYMMETLEDPAHNIMGSAPLDAAGIETIVAKVTGLDVHARAVTLSSGETHGFERAVIATGTRPSLPPIPGIDKAGVFSIRKSLSAMQALRGKVSEAKRIVIIGGGFIGAEFADELARRSDVQIELIEVLPHLMEAAFDDEFCTRIRSVLEKEGVRVRTSAPVASIDGDDRVEAVTLESGERIDADVVIVGVGGKPNTELARAAGLRLDEGRAIWVDHYMRTQVPEVFAVGDCAVKRDFFTRKHVPILLASTATAEARVAGTNLYEIRVMRQIPGTIAAFSSSIAGEAFASAGMTARACAREGFRCISATASAPDRHPGKMPGASELEVKLIFADRSGILVGGQLRGGVSVGELVNVIALGIQTRMTVRDIDSLQIATHPLLTPAPTVHPFVNAAHLALAKLRAGQADTIAPG